MELQIGRHARVGVQAYNLIRYSIIACRFTPGQTLSENEVALQFGVSRTPVREAFIRLADEGLVEIYPQVGTIVSPIRLSQVSESQFIREALECASVRKAAGNVTADQVAELWAIIAEQRRFQESEDYPDFYASDETLHRRLLEIAGYPAAWKVAQSAKAHMDRVRFLSLPVPSQIDHLINQHESVVKAVEKRDPDKAERALQTHLREVFRVVEILSKEYPDYFV